MSATNGDDIIIGTAVGEVINGLAGKDTIRGGGGADTIFGGEGNDTILLYLGDGVSGEKLDGGAGEDTLELGNNASMASIGLTTNFEILKLEGDAVIAANQIADFDTFSSRFGGTNNLFAAAAGTYSFAGKMVAANIRFYGSTAADKITGSAAGDWLRGGGGADTIFGGEGNDTVFLSVGDGVSGEKLDGGGGEDTLELGDRANMASIGLTKNFEILMLDGDATIAASQIADFDTFTSRFGGTNNLFAAAAGTYSFAGKTVASNIRFYGSTAADKITGSAAGDWLSGGGGADSITGGSGDDTFAVVRGAASGVSIADFQGGGTIGGDMLHLYNFGSGASLKSNGGSSYSIVYNGGVENINISSSSILTSQDYRFL